MFHFALFQNILKNNSSGDEMTYLYFCHVFFFPHIKQAFRKYRFYKSHNLQLQNLFKDFVCMVNCETYKICTS